MDRAPGWGSFADIEIFVDDFKLKFQLRVAMMLLFCK